MEFITSRELLEHLGFNCRRKGVRNCLADDPQNPSAWCPVCVLTVRVFEESKAEQEAVQAVQDAQAEQDS